ncbi:GMP synthase [glutamine-hydrolyzing],GMP synthase,3-methyladenine DNA glycosylase,GMP synthase (glutamine-hydrolyzing), C-terminal domain,GMP synthase C terminal domain [Chlamydia serpentis]|uniref:GMP synthase [glutamine-hydrolyzing] n=1 Tax=Chlamydia serpentis TaxID=1967782 RepID=A0A2R8FAI2_9CHLA|nr:glutamine-hydrolyzing GMP synthase [Chlamydia serpentis]SPN73332.1 GMP synthase [glutamine-hydrolyzing],GMP synthase,3-methyladenine DNA glycosylase,GMP synthase (glutamine-hydrolyzing), C-terminal domain,GMP synthase C terminal domain [Chlamydia serpentis]
MISIVIIDFGSQYTYVLAKQIRKLSVYCEVVPSNISAKSLKEKAPLGIILSGGPHSVYDNNSPSLDREIYQLDIPILGICYGMQLIARDFRGTVSLGTGEFGYTLITLYSSDLFQNLVPYQSLDTKIRMSHRDHVTSLPPGFNVIASTSQCPISGIENKTRRLYGLQFHPEVSDSNSVGNQILKTFVQNICCASTNWNTSYIHQDVINTIQDTIGEDEKVILGLSGGVDSSVTAVLLHQAIGDRLVCVFVDTGLLRKHEVEEVKEQFTTLGLNLVIKNAAEYFYQKLTDVIDPEEKRKTLGSTFIEVFDDIAQSLNVQWLAQGTIYSDVIESSRSGYSSEIIKSHHNVGGLPKNLKLKLIEPLRYLFKDEVRILGEALGLPKDLLNKHPFPGPGLAIRVIGKILPEYLNILRQADEIFIEELKKSKLYHRVSQAFALFLPIKSVSVKGDCRSYGYTIALRAVESLDFMTAQWAHLPFDFLSWCSSRIINEIPEVSRVVYDISDKPPGTIEWE